MDTLYLSHFNWPMTPLWLAATDDSLVSLFFGRNASFSDFQNSFSSYTLREKDNGVLHMTKLQLEEYFQGRRVKFNLTVNFLSGTPFQQSVWRAVERIPYGTVKTYGQIAAELGNPRAMRAVGAANGANPVPIVIPCHRVVQSNGKLGGYGGGLDIKDALLRMEDVLF